jgi:hypothetical protein
LLVKSQGPAHAVFGRPIFEGGAIVIEHELADESDPARV